MLAGKLKRSRHCTFTLTALLSVALYLLGGCGGGGGGSETPSSLATTFLEGSVVNRNGEPLPDVEVYIYETYESSITDEHGDFTIQSSSRLGSARVFFKRATYTNKVDLGNFPDSVATVVAGFMIDTATDNAELLGVSFDGTPPAGAEPPPPASSPEAPPSGPGAGPTPRPTPTQKPEIFDSKGNTSAFGIPAGMKGNIAAGAQVWRGDCASCHAVEKTGRTFGQTKGAYRIVPSMQPLSITPQRIADVTAYLNRGRR